MKIKTVERIVKEIFPKIKRYYGPSRYYDDYPDVVLDDSIYDSFSSKKIEDEDTLGEFVFEDNEIVIYYPQMKSKKDIVQTLIHEYQHYLQSPGWFTRYYNMGYDYNNHPYEVYAFNEEKNYKRFL